MEKKIYDILIKHKLSLKKRESLIKDLLGLFGVSEILTPEEKEKNAILKMKLKANSGYRSEETHKVSSDQYGRICKILYETDS